MSLACLRILESSSEVGCKLLYPFPLTFISISYLSYLFESALLSAFIYLPELSCLSAEVSFLTRTRELKLGPRVEGDFSCLQQEES